MFAAILALLAMPFVDLARSRGIQFKPLSKSSFFIFFANFIFLMILGAKHVESPFIEIGMATTFIYFLWFANIIPSFSLIENTALLIRPYVNFDKLMNNTVSSGKRTTASPLVSSIIPNITNVNRFILIIFLLNIVFIIFYLGLDLESLNDLFNDLFFNNNHMMINDAESGVQDLHIPCVRCPTCAENGTETFVIRGKLCPVCNTACSYVIS